ncbi:hypothetical protein NHQ30_005426 [Ciborinia camelliae]|nr:hypothetical protein NHQ30_005426 [Ciborinia camelliae]
MSGQMVPHYSGQPNTRSESSTHNTTSPPETHNQILPSSCPEGKNIDKTPSTLAGESAIELVGKYMTFLSNLATWPFLETEEEREKPREEEEKYPHHNFDGRKQRLKNLDRCMELSGRLEAMASELENFSGPPGDGLSEPLHNGLAGVRKAARRNCADSPGKRMRKERMRK